MGEAHWRSLKRFDDIRKEEGEEGKVEENGAEEYCNSLLELEQTPSLLVCEPFRGQGRCPGSVEPPVARTAAAFCLREGRSGAMGMARVSLYWVTSTSLNSPEL